MQHKKFKLSALLLLGFGLIGLQAQTTGTFTDSRDGKVYKTVKIGEQFWMAENLAYKPTSGNYWAYDNKAKKIAVYGYLYDWETALNVCPSGWHLPTDAEWTQLTDYLGGEGNAGGKLKATKHWESPNTGATNETGFTALPGGLVRHETFDYVCYGGFWWGATEANSYSAWGRYMSNDDSIVSRDHPDNDVGCSVRCLRD